MLTYQVISHIITNLIHLLLIVASITQIFDIFRMIDNNIYPVINKGIYRHPYAIKFVVTRFKRGKKYKLFSNSVFNIMI